MDYRGARIDIHVRLVAAGWVGGALVVLGSGRTFLPHSGAAESKHLAIEHATERARQWVDAELQGRPVASAVPDVPLQVREDEDSPADPTGDTRTSGARQSATDAVSAFLADLTATGHQLDAWEASWLGDAITAIDRDLHWLVPRFLASAAVPPADRPEAWRRRYDPDTPIAETLRDRLRLVREPASVPGIPDASVPSARATVTTGSRRGVAEYELLANALWAARLDRLVREMRTLHAETTAMSEATLPHIARVRRCSAR